MRLDLAILAQSAYRDWCLFQQGQADDGTPLPVWDNLSGRTQAAWGTAALTIAALIDDDEAGRMKPYGGQA